jgi:hypothetical protein
VITAARTGHAAAGQAIGKKEAQWGRQSLQLLEQISLQFDTPCAVLEMAAADQEGVFDTFAERGNLGGMQIGAMGCQLRRDE